MVYCPDHGRYVAVDMTPHYEKAHGLVCVDSSFSMLNLLTSKVNGKELQNQMNNIWRIARYLLYEAVIYDS